MRFRPAARYSSWSRKVRSEETFGRGCCSTSGGSPMGVFQWEEMYSVQVASFDRQHQGLFRATNELNEALLAGCGKDVAGKILQRLIDYTASHFAAEEAAMNMTGYPELEAHQAEHRALVEQVVKFQEDFHADKPGVAVALMQFLQKWLCHHIMETDKKYGPFLNEKGIH